jgi:hypothetical protein
MADDRTRLSAARLPVLQLHQALIQAERRSHQATHGAVTPVEFLQVLLNAEALAWLKPMTALILAIDEQLDDKAASPAALAESLRHLRALVDSTDETRLAQHLQRLAPIAPELAGLHSAVIETLRDD